MKELRFFETSVNIYESTRRNSLEYFNVLQQDLCPSATSICVFLYGLASNENNTVSNRPVNPTYTPWTHLLLSPSFRLTTAPPRTKTVRFSFNIQKETAVQNTCILTGNYKQQSLAICSDFKLQPRGWLPICIQTCQMRHFELRISWFLFVRAQKYRHCRNTMNKTIVIATSSSWSSTRT